MDFDSVEDTHPRVLLNASVKRLCDVLKDKYAKENETCLCFPSYAVAKRCREYITIKASLLDEETTRPPKVRILQLATSKPMDDNERCWKRECKIAVVFVKDTYRPLLREYWRLAGEIISGRLAEYVMHELFMVEKSTKVLHTDDESISKPLINEKEEFIESRFGRSLNFTFAERASDLIKKRITRKVVDSDLEIESENNHFDDSHDHYMGDYHDNDDGSMPMFLDTDVSNLQHGFEEQYAIHSTIPPEPIDMDNERPTTPTNGHIASTASPNIATEERDGETEHTSSRLCVNPDTDVYLFTSGMASLFTAHRLLLNFDSQRVDRLRSSVSASEDASINSNVTNNNGNARVIGYGSPYKKTAMFGFPYVDTLQMLKKFNHTHFLPFYDSKSLQDLQTILHSGEQILAVFIEAPSNPLLQMCDLIELQKLSEIYGFFIVVDETIGGFVNLDGLFHADIVCSSLTKVFNGDSNVIAGSIVLNPKSKIYEFAQQFLNGPDGVTDSIWCEDLIYLEKNSRDFVAKTLRINYTTEYLLDNVFKPHVGKLFKRIYYPSQNSEEIKQNYEAIKCKKDGGYGGVFSVTFFQLDQAKVFFNNLKLTKQITLGNNSTTVCPYTMLKHKDELERVKEYGLEDNLIRVCVGLENKNTLRDIFQFAIDKALQI